MPTLFTQKIILSLAILCACIAQTYAMDKKLDFNSVEEATLLVPPFHPWSMRDCRFVVNICRRMLELSRMPTTQIYDIEKLIRFTKGMILEICTDQCGIYYADEKHRLFCYKKLMTWEIAKRKSWLHVSKKPNTQLKRSFSYESKWK